MKAASPFDHRPDKVLGKALRELLTPADHQAFVAEVVASARRQIAGTPAPNFWDILGAWMGPGLVAAAALVLATLAGMQGGGSVDYVTIDDELSNLFQTPEERAMMFAPAPPDADVVLVSAYEN
jgi:hypothetical protein